MDGGFWRQKPPDGRTHARAPQEEREDGRAEPGGDSRRGRNSGHRAASLGPTFRRADRRPRPRGRRNAQARGQRAEHEPRGPARHLAPRRVQRRGVGSKARHRALRGGEERQRRAGGSKNRDASGGAVLAVLRAARQRREVRRGVVGIGVLFSVIDSDNGQDLFELFQ